MPDFILKYKNRFWILLTLTLAFALRVYRLNGQSLWNDEGTSVALSALSLQAIIDGAARDIHPPLYYLLLHGWMGLSGQTEFAVRFLSVLAGLLIVALTYRIARSFFSRPVALAAALLSSLSPFQVYYSQETRMYIWATLFAALSFYGMMRWLQDPPPEGARGPRSSSGAPRRAFAVLYLVATMAALYTHYFAVTLLALGNLALALWLFRAWRDRRPVARMFWLWIGAQVLIGLAYLPWVIFAGNQLASWPSISEPFDLPVLLWRVLNVYSAGLTAEPAAGSIAAAAFAILFLLGLRRAREPRRNFGTAILLLWAVIPTGVMYLVSLSRPAYNPKFLLLATPPFLILVARGLETVDPRRFAFTGSRPRGRASLSFVLLGVVVLTAIGAAPSLANYYADPRFARDDYRSILQVIDAGPRPGDGILVDDKGQMDVVRYYHRGDQAFFLLPRMRPPEPAATRADVDEMLGRTRRLYAIYYATEQSDPGGIVEGRLAEQAFKARDTWYGNVRLAVYGTAPAVRPAPHPVGARVGPEIAFVSYCLDRASVNTGDVLTLTLNWRAEERPPARYKVFVHLLDANNQVVAQRDGEPVADRRITTTWQAGETIADNYGLWIDEDTLPGEYRIEMGMYRADDGARLPVALPDGRPAGDHLILDTVRVLK